MITLNKEQQSVFNTVVQTVVEHTLYQASQVDALDNPEYLACEIIDLSQWCSPNLDWPQHIANKVLSSYNWPLGVYYPVKQFFGLAY
jgi:hypothetical protein